MKILWKYEEVYTPDVVLAELARKHSREGISEDTIRERLEVIKRSSIVVPIDESIALKTAECYIELTKES